MLIKLNHSVNFVHHRGNKVLAWKWMSVLILIGREKSLTYGKRNKYQIKLC